MAMEEKRGYAVLLEYELSARLSPLQAGLSSWTLILEASGREGSLPIPNGRATRFALMTLVA